MQKIDQRDKKIGNADYKQVSVSYVISVFHVMMKTQEATMMLKISERE